MQAADHERAALGDLFETLQRLQRDASGGDDLVEMKEFGIGAAEVFPHVAGEPLALVERHVGVGGGQIVQHALLPAEPGRNQPPGGARTARCGFQRQSDDRRREQPESGIFQPVAQAH